MMTTSPAGESPVPVRLLLVEDSPVDAELSLRALAAEGFAPSAERVECEEDLARALRDDPPEAVLCDYRMPRLEGPRALEVTRSIRPHIPFILLSGSIGELQAVDLLKAGATDLVMKDRLNRLGSSLRRALREARERSDLAIAENELKHSREQLLQAQKMEAVGRLAGGVAHDLNNILTTVSGYSELLMAGLPEASPHREEVAEIIAASDRAANLTRQLLAFSRRQVLEVRVVELNAVIRGVERLLRRVIGEDVSIQLALDPALRRVRADATQLEQVLMNLAINARDAMPRGGLLAVSTRNVDDRVELAVADTGEGMTPEVQARAFEPFFTTKEKGKGTGLGLSTVYGIVSQCGGSIAIDSGPGRGTRFLIAFPATDEAVDAAPGAKASAAPPGGGERVLVVEDESSLRSLVRRVLVERGYRVVEASGPAEALRAHEQGEFDVAVIDVVMPGMNGPALIERLRERRPGLKALIISGYADQAPVPKPQHGRPFPFLAKPFTSAALLTKLRETLDSPL